MSWKATYFVKTLTKHQDGKPLTARQKLVLFVLADYHHEEKGFAWVSTRRAAIECLTSHKWLFSILASLEKHGTITIERREGKTHLYRFPGLMKSVHQSSGSHFITTDEVRVHHTDEVITSPKPLIADNNRQEAAFPQRFLSKIEFVRWAIEESHRTRRHADEIMKEELKG